MERAFGVLLREREQDCHSIRDVDHADSLWRGERPTLVLHHWERAKPLFEEEPTALVEVGVGSAEEGWGGGGGGERGGGRHRSRDIAPFRDAVRSIKLSSPDQESHRIASETPYLQPPSALMRSFMPIGTKAKVCFSGFQSPSYCASIAPGSDSSQESNVVPFGIGVQAFPCSLTSRCFWRS